MPLIKQQFKIDMFQLKHTKDGEELRQAYFDDYARRLGAKLIEVIPYEKTEAFEGELPQAVLTKDHHFTETWGVEFVVLTREQWEQIPLLFRQQIEREG